MWFNENLLNTFYVLGIVVNAGSTAWSKETGVSPPGPHSLATGTTQQKRILPTSVILNFPVATLKNQEEIVELHFNVYVWLNPFTVHLKLSQHCLLISYTPIQNKRFKKMFKRILGWVTYPFSRGSSQPRNQTNVSQIAGGFFTNWAIREAQKNVFKK